MCRNRHFDGRSSVIGNNGFRYLHDTSDRCAFANSCHNENLLLYFIQHCESKNMLNSSLRQLSTDLCAAYTVVRLGVCLSRMEYGKMAASAVVLCNPLCFLANKFGRTATRPLKSMVLDFCDVGVLSNAKCRALG